MSLPLRFAALLLALCAFDGSAAQQPIVVRFSHVSAPDTPKGRAAEHFRQLVEERAGGRVRVEIFPGGTLYGDRDEIEAVQLGAVQMIAPSLPNFRALGLREFELFDLPYLFDSYADLRKVIDGPVGVALFAKLDAKGLHGLAYWDVGFKQMSANRPLRMPEDFKGLRMRIRSSKIIEAQMRALGAVPVTLPFNETARALQGGLVDGAENPPWSFVTEQMDASQRFLTLSNHGYIGNAVVVNRKFWEKLPADVRATLERAMREATLQANALSRERNDEALATVRRNGHTTIITLTPEEKAAWKRTLVAIHRQSEDRIPRDLIQRIYAETGFRPE